MNWKLREARKARCWSQQEAAAEANVDTQTYARWEKGQQDPHPHNLDLLCKAFHMSAVDLGVGHLEGAIQEDEVILQSAQNGTVRTLTAEQVTYLVSLLRSGRDMK